MRVCVCVWEDVDALRGGNMAHDDFLHSIPPCRDPRGRSAWLSSRAMKGRGIKQIFRKDQTKTLRLLG